MMQDKKIHPTQIKILELIKNNQGKIPTIRQITQALNLSSVSIAHHHLKKIKENNLLYKNINFQAELSKANILLKRARNMLLPLVNFNKGILMLTPAEKLCDEIKDFIR